jgi:hypothetical protein
MFLSLSLSLSLSLKYKVILFLYYTYLPTVLTYLLHYLLGWQIFGRNLAEDWLLKDGITNDSGPTTNVTDNASNNVTDNSYSNSNTFFKNNTIGAIASLPDSQWCNNAKEDYYPDYFNWYFIIGVYNIPLNILCLMNVYIPVRDFLVSLSYTLLSNPINRYCPHAYMHDTTRHDTIDC